MPFNPLSGVQGSVQIGGFVYTFGKWDLTTETKGQLVNNFSSNGRQQVVPGVTSAELSLEALTYDLGNMPLVTGSSYVMILGYDATHSFQAIFYVESINMTVDYDGLQSVKVKAKSNDITFLSLII